MPGLRILDDVAQIFEIALQHVERAQPVERLHGVIGVADPAVAIVPVAPGIGMLGDRGGERGDDRAGFLMLAKLQRDRRSDHHVLPFERGGEAAHPALPLDDRVVQHALDRGGEAGREAFIGTEEEVQRALHPEQPLLLEKADRRVGRKAYRLAIEDVADVVRSGGGGDVALAPAPRRAQADADARAAGHRPHDAHEGDGAVDAFVAGEARAEIGDFDGAAVGILQPGDEDRRVAQIMLLGLDAAVEVDRPQSVRLLLLGLGARQQRGEDGLAIDARQAGPDEAAGTVDQRGDLAIADRPEVEIGRHAGSSPSLRPARWRSQRCTAATSGSP